MTSPRRTDADAIPTRPEHAAPDVSPDAGLDGPGEMTEQGREFDSALQNDPGGGGAELRGPRAGQPAKSANELAEAEGERGAPGPTSTHQPGGVGDDNDDDESR